MKKSILILATASMVLFTGAAHAFFFSTAVKLGTSRAADPGRWGFNMGVQMEVSPIPYLLIGMDQQAYWSNWSETFSTSASDATHDMWNSPLLFTIKINFGNPLENVFVPYITGGIGYSWMSDELQYPDYYTAGSTYIPSRTIRRYYEGMAWQAIAGFMYNWASGSDTGFGLGLEGGYRGCKMESGIYNKDMSGWIVNFVMQFSLDVR